MRTALLAILCAAGLSGCARTHLHPSVGRSYRRVLHGQRAERPLARGERPVAGLDSEESSRLYHAYLERFGKEPQSRGRGGGGGLSDALGATRAGGGGY